MTRRGLCEFNGSFYCAFRQLRWTGRQFAETVCRELGLYRLLDWLVVKLGGKL